jgi:hypothetical protein
MFWRKRASVSAAPVDRCAHMLFQALVEGLKTTEGVRAEDVITVAASITGELCIEAAGEFNPRKHQFGPGSRILSDKVNELLFGDVPEAAIDMIPATSIVGILRDQLLRSGYSKADFPCLKTVCEHFAANIGTQDDWGKVPLAVPDKNQPFVLPLQVAYETRSLVDQIFQPLSGSEDKLRAAALALAEALVAVRQAIDAKTAVLLALQMVNGMAKTAPMTDEAMESLSATATGG